MKKKTIREPKPLKCYPSGVTHKDMALALLAALTPFAPFAVPKQDNNSHMRVTFVRWYNLTPPMLRALRSLTHLMRMKLLITTGLPVGGIGVMVFEKK